MHVKVNFDSFLCDFVDVIYFLYSCFHFNLTYYVKIITIILYLFQISDILG